MTTVEARPVPIAPAVEPRRTMPEQLADWVDEARADMATAPTATDWMVDASVWLSRYALLVAVLAVTWPLYLPRGARWALLLTVVLMAPAGYLAGTLTG